MPTKIEVLQSVQKILRDRLGNERDKVIFLVQALDVISKSSLSAEDVIERIGDQASVYVIESTGFRAIGIGMMIQGAEVLHVTHVLRSKRIRPSEKDKYVIEARAAVGLGEAVLAPTME